MADPFYEAQSFLSKIFGVPQSWFTGPQLVINLIIPYIISMVAFYLVLSERIKLFRRSNIVNWIVSFLLAFFSLPVVLLLGPHVAIGFGVLVIVVISGGKITLKRLLLGISLAVVAFLLTAFVSVWLMGALGA